MCLALKQPDQSQPRPPARDDTDPSFRDINETLHPGFRDARVANAINRRNRKSTTSATGVASAGLLNLGNSDLERQRRPLNRIGL